MLWLHCTYVRDYIVFCPEAALIQLQPGKPDRPSKCGRFMINSKIDCKSTNFRRRFWYWSEIHKILTIFRRDFDIDFKFEYEFIKVVFFVFDQKSTSILSQNMSSLMSLSWSCFSTRNRRRKFSLLRGENINCPKNIGFWKSTRFRRQFQSESKIGENSTKFRRRFIVKIGSSWVDWCCFSGD